MQINNNGILYFQNSSSHSLLYKNNFICNSAYNGGVFYLNNTSFANISMN